MSVSQLCENQAALGHEISVYTTTANGSEELDVDPGTTLEVDGVAVSYFSRITGDHTHISPALWKHLWKTCKSYDIIHLHSWWSPLMIFAAYICSLRGKRPILSPRGMLGTYTFVSTNSPAKKLIHALVGKRGLLKTILHATTKMELDECLEIIPSWPHMVLPNIVALPNQPIDRTESKVFTIGFLSRIDAKKGIELTIEALSKVSFPYVFKIAGKGEDSYVNQLKDKADHLGISQHIKWCGWKSDHEKFDFLAGCDLFVLTSYNENFANVVIEALSVGTPVLISNKVGLHDYIAKKQLGWITTLEPDVITDKLNDAHQKVTKSEISSPVLMQEIVTKDFSGNELAQKYLDSYHSLS